MGKRETTLWEDSILTVRFSGRLDRPLLRPGLMGLSLRKAALSSDWDAQGSARMPKWEHLDAERGSEAAGSTCPVYGICGDLERRPARKHLGKPPELAKQGILVAPVLKGRS